MAATFLGVRSQGSEPVSGLIMEIKVADSDPIIKFPLRKDQPTGFWSPRVTRIQGWQPSPGKPMAEAVSFRAILVGEKIHFKVLMKPKTSETDEQEICDHVLAIGETIEVKELRDYGYEPITARVRKVGLLPAGSLSVENWTNAIRTTVDSTIPKFGEISIHLTNVSKKPVIAVSCYVHQAGYALLYPFPLGKQGRVLLEPNGAHDFEIALESLDGMYGGVTLVVRTVIFADGTHEGNAGPSALLGFQQEGERMALERLLPILRGLEELDSIDILATVAKIDGMLEKLTNENVSVMSSYNNLVRETGVHFRKIESSESATVLQYVAELAADYQQWLERLRRAKR